MNGDFMEIVKVSAHSVPKSVAGAIAAVIREYGEVEVQAVVEEACGVAHGEVVTVEGVVLDNALSIGCGYRHKCLAVLRAGRKRNGVALVPSCLEEIERIVRRRCGKL